MKKKRVRTSILVAAVALLLLVALVSINYKSIFQEGNPLPLVAGMCKLELSGQRYVKVKEAPESFLTRTNDYVSLFSSIEESYDVEYTKTSEAGYAFTGAGGELTLLCRQYTRSYQVWEVVEREQ